MTVTEEYEADLAFRHQTEIEAAADWCKKLYPHRFDFLNQMYLLLTQEERHFKNMGLPTRSVRPQPILTILTPSQALRLLEAYKRAALNSEKAWHTKHLTELEALEADARRAKVIAEIRAAWNVQST